MKETITMPRIDEIYQILIDFIERDSDYKLARAKEQEYIKSKLESIDTQAKLTNGRVTKLESDVFIIKGNEKTEVIIKKVNWKWILSIASVVWFIFSTTLFFLIDIVQEIIKKYYSN